MVTGSAVRSPALVLFGAATHPARSGAATGVAPHQARLGASVAWPNTPSSARAVPRADLLSLCPKPPPTSPSSCLATL
eukprot:scaffold2616_cov106-Isochrysis_galbana.AAC.4